MIACECISHVQETFKPEDVFREKTKKNKKNKKNKKKKRQSRRERFLTSQRTKISSSNTFNTYFNTQEEEEKYVPIFMPLIK